MAAFGDGGIFRRHAEGIEAHWIEYIETHQPFVPRNSVAYGVISNVPHVHFSGRVGVHLEAVKLGFLIVNVGVEEARLVPFFLPTKFVHWLCIG